MIEYWKNHMLKYDNKERLFNLICPIGKDYITPKDFEPFITHLINHNPSLDFLTTYGNFVNKYSGIIKL